MLPTYNFKHQANPGKYIKSLFSLHLRKQSYFYLTERRQKILHPYLNIASKEQFEATPSLSKDFAPRQNLLSAHARTGTNGTEFLLSSC